MSKEYKQEYIETKEDIIKALQEDKTVFEMLDDTLICSYNIFANRKDIILQMRYNCEIWNTGIMIIDVKDFRTNSNSKYYTLKKE